MSPLRAALLALGPALFALGLWATPALADVLKRPLAMTLALLLVPWALAIGIAAIAGGRLRVATVLAAGWAVGLVVFAGPLPLAATALLAAAALALGDRVLSSTPATLRIVVGLVPIAGVLGWLLPFPLHRGWIYAPVLLALVASRPHAVLATLRALPGEWRGAVAAAPRAAAWAVATLGVATTTLWLPTMQFDDVAYHLGLPSQLQQLGHYRFDAMSQVWALAPWAGDVLHAVVQVLAGGEGRGALNALWLALLASGVFRLAQALGEDARGAFAAVALAASTPMLLWLLGGMQVELPTAVLLIAMAWVLATPVAASPWLDETRRTWALALLAAGLMALKASNALLAAPFAVWWLAQTRARLPWKSVVAASVVAIVLGASSYAYAAWLSGNPFLPMFNDAFPNAYEQGSRLDVRWFAGVGAVVDLPWRIAFETGRYVEAYPGGPGFLLVLLAGPVLAALARGPARALALVGLAAWLLPLLVIQYARYALPAVLLLAPVAVAGARRLGARPGFALLVLCWAAQMLFLANGSWQWRAGAPRYLLSPNRGETVLLSKLQPERVLAATLRDDPDVRVLAAGTEPTHAEYGGRGFTIVAHDPTLAAAARAAGADGSVAAWRRFLRSHGFTHVTVRAGSSATLRAALPAMRAERIAVSGDAELWRLPAWPRSRDLMAERDLSRQLRGDR